MKKENKKIKEPFEPNNTPKPPQIIDPNTGRDRENPVKEQDRPDDRPENSEAAGTKKTHLLSDETDIDDETTI